MEENPTKLENILLAMPPEDFERALHILKLVKEQKAKMMDKNYVGARKTIEEQRKHPIDLEFQNLNAKDHANHSEYLQQIQELQKRHGKEITER